MCAALGVAFVRAHNGIGHPFARSVVPLIPTVIAMTGGAAENTRGFDKKCGVLLSSPFAKSHCAGGRSGTEARWWTPLTLGVMTMVLCVSPLTAALDCLICHTSNKQNHKQNSDLAHLSFVRSRCPL
jgi:hypothetical protein